MGGRPRSDPHRVSHIALPIGHLNFHFRSFLCGGVRPDVVCYAKRPPAAPRRQTTKYRGRFACAMTMAQSNLVSREPGIRSDAYMRLPEPAASTIRRIQRTYWWQECMRTGVWVGGRIVTSTRLFLLRRAQRRSAPMHHHCCSLPGYQ